MDFSNAKVVSGEKWSYFYWLRMKQGKNAVFTLALPRHLGSLKIEWRMDDDDKGADDTMTLKVCRSHTTPLPSPHRTSTQLKSLPLPSPPPPGVQQQHSAGVTRERNTKWCGFLKHGRARIRCDLDDHGHLIIGCEPPPHAYHPHGVHPRYEITRNNLTLTLALTLAIEQVQRQ